MMTHPLDNNNLQRREDHDDDEQELLNSLVRELSFWELPERPTGRSQSVDGTSRSSAANSILQESSRSRKRRSMRRTRSNGNARSSSPNRESVALSSLKKKTNGSSSSSRDSSHAAETASSKDPPPPAQRMWKTAFDPVSGRTYYYDSITRKTQWEKPAEIRAMEKKRKQEKRKAEQAFFDTMKANLLASLRRGELIPKIPRDQMVQQGPPKEPLLLSDRDHHRPQQQIRVRTISGMNEQLLAELHRDHHGGGSSHTSTTTTTPHLPLPVASSSLPVTTTTTTVTGVNGVGSSSSLRTATGNGGPSAEGRPPLPQRRPSTSLPPHEATQQKPAADDSMELSPEHHSHLASAAASEDVPPESDLLRGEHLLDGPILGEQLEQPDAAALTVPSLASTTNSTTSSVTTTTSSTTTTTSHVRRNTGGTIYVQSTMENPDVKATIKCVCGVYRAHIVQAANNNRQQPNHHHQRSPVSSVHTPANVNLDIFRDDYESNSHVSYQHLDRNYYNKRNGADDAGAAATTATTTIPSLSEIEIFYHDFYKRSQMEHDTIIMSLIYVERLIKETNGALTPQPSNWQSILFSCMVLSSKVWDDLSMFNLDFSNVSMASGLSSFSLQRTNALELAVLTSLNFNVRVPASEYAKYYFLIRTMLSRSGLLQGANLPLTKKDEGKVLESRTSHYQDSRLQGRSERRTRSVDFSVLGDDTQPVLKDTVCLEQLVSMDR